MSSEPRKPVQNTLSFRMRVIFVCTGNICRSPAAHAVLEAKLLRQPWAKNIQVDSAGMGGWHAGELPDERAQEEGLRRGYAVTHLARRVESGDFGKDCLLVALDKSHFAGLRKLAPPGFSMENLVFLRSFDLNAASLDVADPYYGNAADFAVMFEVIEAAMPGLIQHLKEQLDVR